MPDEYMNLTDAEAAELGYRVHRPERRGPRNRPPEAAAEGWGPPEEVVFGLLFFLMACLFAAGIWSAIHPSNSASALPDTVTTAHTAASEAAPPAQIPAGQSQPVPQAYQTPPQQYLPAGWEYSRARSPIRLWRGNRIAAIIPAGSDFLCSWGTINGYWSFVLALDGETWGWARLTRDWQPRRVPMQAKFEKALIRLRQMQSEPLYRALVVYHSEAPGSDLNGAARETINRSAAVESATRACNEAQAERQLSELIQAIANFDTEGRDHAAVQPQN